MRIDRWGRLDAFAIREELLDEWGLTLADGSSGPPLDPDDRVAAALIERDNTLAAVEQLQLEQSKNRDEALATAAQLQQQLTTERDQALATAAQL